MNIAGNTIDNVQKNGISTVSQALLQLAEESFNKEKKVYNQLLDFKIEKVDDFIQKGDTLFKFLIALSDFFSNSQNNFILNSSGEKEDTTYSLDFSENSFLEVMASPSFYDQINFNTINQIVYNCLGDTYEDWYSKNCEAIEEFINDVRTTQEEIETKFKNGLVSLISNTVANNTSIKQNIDDNINKAINLSTETSKWIKQAEENKKSKADIRKDYHKFNNYTKKNFRKDVINFLKGKEVKNDLLDYNQILEDIKTKGTYSNIQSVSKAFYDLIGSALKKIDEEYFKSFEAWWKAKIQQNANNLFSEIINKMLSVKNREKFIGNLGEIMLKLFNNQFFTLPVSENNNEKQQEDNFITGGVRNKYGEIAVDNLLLFKQAQEGLEYLGFQSKLFPSYELQGEGIFYQQSNQIYGEQDSLNKYLQEDTDLFKINLFCYSFDEFENERSVLSEEMLDILGKHIPEYIRMIDTTEGISEKELKGFLVQEMEKSGIIMNNFYSINFRIFPSSLILLLLSKHIENEKKNNKDIINNSFYISIKEPVKKDGKLRWRTSGIIEDNQKNFQSSLANNDILQLIQKKQSKEKEATVFLNFKGINIKFKSANINNLVNFAI